MDDRNEPRVLRLPASHPTGTLGAARTRVSRRAALAERTTFGTRKTQRGVSPRPYYFSAVREPSPPTTFWSSWLVGCLGFSVFKEAAFVADFAELWDDFLLLTDFFMASHSKCEILG